ncbi:hypothetical protein V2G26_020293 [Clonostachys chloroleuca]
MFRAVEDRPTPKEVYNWRLYFEASVIATGSFLFGYDSAFIGTTIARKSFKDDFNVYGPEANNISSNITASFQAGAFFGAIFCFLITEKLGRKWALQIANVVFMIGAVIMTAATNQLSFIYAGRVLTGLACGAITATVPSYIAEISVTSIRGILTGLFEVTYQSGSLIGFWINYGINVNMDLTSTATWRIPMAVQIIPSGLLLIFGWFLHESPLWLFRNDRDDLALQALQDLRHLPSDHQYLQEEILQIRIRLEEEALIAKKYGSGSWSYFRGALFELSRKGMWNRVLLVFCSFALQNMSGAAAINYYSPTLFGSLGITDVSLWTGIYGLVKAVASIIFYGALIDIWGRRNPTIISSLACSLCLWFVGAVFWSFGLNGIPWIVSAEIFPGALRNLTGTWAALCQWLVQFVLTKALPYIFASFNYGTWFFFACWMLLATIWAFFFLPETKGKTLEEFDIIFGYTENRTTPMLASKTMQGDDKDDVVEETEHRLPL